MLMSNKFNELMHKQTNNIKGRGYSDITLKKQIKI